MALFFAVDQVNPPAPAVYIYDGSEFDGAILNDQSFSLQLNNQYFIPDQPTIVILSPTRHSQRVVAQSGWHTVHPLGTDENSRVVEPMNTSIDTERLAVVEIEPQRALEIKIDLRQMGIDSATVYGDLPSICREIEYDSQYVEFSEAPST